MLRLKFDSKLDFQIGAINSVVDIFKGQIKKLFDYTFQVVPNLLDLPKERIFENLQEIQKKNGLPLSNIDELKEPMKVTENTWKDYKQNIVKKQVLKHHLLKIIEIR